MICLLSHVDSGSDGWVGAWCGPDPVAARARPGMTFAPTGEGIKALAVSTPHRDEGGDQCAVSASEVADEVDRAGAGRDPWARWASDTAMMSSTATSKPGRRSVAGETVAERACGGRHRRATEPHIGLTHAHDGTSAPASSAVWWSAA
jgi:hypothetical protein